MPIAIHPFVLSILLAGDIQTNPGPSSIYPCGICNQEVTLQYKGICCENEKCGVWFHHSCVDVDSAEYVLLGRSNVQWLCPRRDSMNCDSFTFNSFELSCHNSFAPLRQYTSITSPSSTDPFSSKHTSSPNHPTCDSHKSYNRSIPFERSTQHTPPTSTPRSKCHVFDLPKKMNLRILNVNFQSLKNKRAEFLTALQYTTPDIVFGTETWLRGVKPGKSTT